MNCRGPVLRLYIPAGFVLAALSSLAQTPSAITPYISEDARILVLDPVRAIDGTGAPPAEDQRIVIEAGKIVRL
jgi:hypothetical protein